MKHIIGIDENACIGCGMCVKDCPASNIDLGDGKAQVKGQDCLMCGHCVAVCPKNAVSISGFSEEPVEMENQPRLNSEELYEAIKFRRSIRQFKDEKIDRDIIDRIIQVGRYTPTAKNNQDVQYIVLERQLVEAESLAVKYFNKMKAFFGLVYPRLKEAEISKDFFFKGAPLAIMVISDNKINASLAASNMALMAEAEGLGVLYSGFFSRAVNKHRPLRNFLVMDKTKVATTLVLGYPNVKYHRSAQKEDANVRYL